MDQWTITVSCPVPLAGKVLRVSLPDFSIQQRVRRWVRSIGMRSEPVESNVMAFELYDIVSYRLRSKPHELSVPLPM